MLKKVQPERLQKFTSQKHLQVVNINYQLNSGGSNTTSICDVQKYYLLKMYFNKYIYSASRNCNNRNILLKV